MDALAVLGIAKAYHLAPLTRDPRVGRIITNIGLPWVWEKQYRARLHLIDPIPGIALERLEPVYWPDELPKAKLDLKQRRYLAIAAQYGLGRGIGVACFGPDGRSGFLGAVLPPKGDPPELKIMQRVYAVGQASFQVYCRIIKNARQLPALSNRELEVLHWIGRGKSNSVIADILGISPSSVDVYVRRIFAKLDVTDRTTASIKAVSLGLMVTGDYERFVRETIGRSDMQGDPLG
ncbi:helix-turn-helix transcriptional regulator [Alteraurantiacibacter aquimixticola]|nr:LuxR family transcriptional regulator [Alteraurantiacibacter aquimixticola]